MEQGNPVGENAGERICLFGGTFDPIHNAHLRIALESLKALQLTQVLFVPAGHPPHKQLSQITPYEHRFRMVELACAGWRCFVASRLEAGDNYSYSIDSVKKLRQSLSAADRLFFLIGSDAFDEIETWHRWRDLVREVEFIVVSRPGAEFRIAPGARVHRLEGLALPVSSTGIRDRLARGEPTPEIPPKVRGYIEEHSLYGFPIKS
jgi:nicotinate-nucleotide adenylyltransferase